MFLVAVRFAGHGKLDQVLHKRDVMSHRVKKRSSMNASEASVSSQIHSADQASHARRETVKLTK